MIQFIDILTSELRSYLKFLGLKQSFWGDVILVCKLNLASKQQVAPMTTLVYLGKPLTNSIIDLINSIIDFHDYSLLHSSSIRNNGV